MESNLPARGFAVRFDRLRDFLITQGIYLDQREADELANRYTGNDQEVMSSKVFLSFKELENLLRQAR